MITSKSFVRYPGILLAVLGLLVLSMSASAEATWVLWGHDQLVQKTGQSSKPYAPSQSWSVLKSSIATRPECDAQAKKAVEDSIEAAKSRGLRYTVHETTVTATDENATFLKRASYLCLSDTVDPRGPKAGGR
jgi:hypothetical protein